MGVLSAAQETFAPFYRLRQQLPLSAKMRLGIKITAQRAKLDVGAKASTKSSCRQQRPVAFTGKGGRLQSERSAAIIGIRTLDHAEACNGSRGRQNGAQNSHCAAAILSRSCRRRVTFDGFSPPPPCRLFTRKRR